jgi:hypothetical protein
MWRVIPIIFGVLFSVIAVLVFNAVGPNVLGLGFAAFGAIFILIGGYYWIFRIEYRDGNFVVYPGERTYGVEDVAFWKVCEDSDASPGYQRYIELGFDRWYRRYVLSESDVSARSFDNLVSLLEDIRSRKN